jgi:cytosine/adenosine deaminase-related metal-dependent hydrolase
MQTLLTAAWIAPMTGPPLRDAGVVFDSQHILAIGPLAALRGSYPQAEIWDAGNSVILPGLVNAHTHLELSSIVRSAPPARFVDWIIDLMGRGSAIDTPAAMRLGIQQCLRFGVTSVGDITVQPQVTRPEIAASPLQGVSYGEVRAMAQRRGFLDARLSAAIEPAAIQPGIEPGIQPGISPHAPYSIEREGYVRCLAQSVNLNLPLTTHLAETPDEAAFLADHTGPFKALWEYLNAWDERVPRFAGGPIRFAKAVGLLDYPTLLAHVNYCDDAELDLLAQGRASVVYCPRTHEFFGHPPHRWREMQARGINVAVGTDSCASSPDLNLVDELRLLHRLAPQADPMTLWQMATTNAAAALQRTDVGSLVAGHRADAVIFAAKSDDPLREILEQPLLPMQVWAGGVLL